MPMQAKGMLASLSDFVGSSPSTVRRALEAAVWAHPTCCS